MGMHKAEMNPRKVFIASTQCTVVLWSLFTSCAGIGFFVTEIVILDHIDRDHVSTFFILALGALLCSIPYYYAHLRWAVCERCFCYVCFKKMEGTCGECEARYVQFGKNVFRDHNK